MAFSPETNNQNVQVQTGDANVVDQQSDIEVFEDRLRDAFGDSFDRERSPRLARKMTRDADDYNQGFYDSLSGVSEFLAAPISFATASERVAGLDNLFKETLAALPKSGLVNNFSITQYSGDDVGSLYPMFIATFKKTNSRDEVIAISYAVMVVETEDTIEPLLCSAGGKQLELPRTALDAYNGVVDAAVRRVILRTVTNGDADIPVVFSGVSTLYRENKLQDDVQAKIVISALSQQCVSAIIDETALTKDPAGTANLGELIRATGSELVANLRTNTQGMKGADGMPIHADVVISTKAMPPAHVRNMSNEVLQSRPRPILDVGVAIDLVRVNSATSFGRRNRREDTLDPMYIGNVIITHIGNPTGLVTVASSLLAISTAMITQSEEIYPELLKPHGDPQYKLLGDFGSIGYELPSTDGTVGKIDIFSAEFIAHNGRAMRELVAETLYPDLMLSIDIPESILGSRATKIISRSAYADENRDKDSERARVAAVMGVVDTLDKLTNGAFTAEVWGGGEIVDSNPIYIPMGYWVDNKGNQRDLREINYLAALEHSGQTSDPDFILDWQDTFATGRDAVTAAAARIELMEEIVGKGNVHVKDYAWRYTFEASFIEEAARACQLAGIAPTFNNLSAGDRRRIHSGYEAYSRFMINHDSANRYASAARAQRRTDNGRGFGSRRGVFGR